MSSNDNFTVFVLVALFCMAVVVDPVYGGTKCHFCLDESRDGLCERTRVRSNCGEECVGYQALLFRNGQTSVRHGLSCAPRGGCDDIEGQLRQGFSRVELFKCSTCKGDLCNDPKQVPLTEISKEDEQRAKILG